MPYCGHSVAIFLLATDSSERNSSVGLLRWYLRLPSYLIRGNSYRTQECAELSDVESSRIAQATRAKRNSPNCQASLDVQTQECVETPVLAHQF